MLQKMLAAQKRKKSERKNEAKRNSSGKIEFKKLVANVETSIVLLRQAHKAAPCSAEAEVDSSNNGELGLYPDPRHYNRADLSHFVASRLAKRFWYAAYCIACFCLQIERQVLVQAVGTTTHSSAIEITLGTCSRRRPSKCTAEPALLISSKNIASHQEYIRTRVCNTTQ